MRFISAFRLAAPLRSRDYRLLWSANLISQLGDGVTTVALALEALRLDPAPSGLAAVLAARTIPAVALALLGGVVADRLPRRTSLLAADVVRGLAVGLVAGLVLLAAINVWGLAAMAVVFGIADAFGGPAQTAILPEVVSADSLTAANALNSTTSQLSVNLVGPALGGVAAAAVGVAGSFAFDAATFVVSAGLTAAVQTRQRPHGERTTVVREALQGLRYIASRRWLFILLVGAALANLTGLGPYTVLLPTLVRHVLRAGPVALGLVYGAGGAAGVVASLLAARLGEPKHLLETMWAAYGLSGLMVVALSQAPDPFAAGALSAAAAGLVVYGDVLYFTRLQRSVPAALLGRVSSASFVMVMTLTPVGMVLGGVLGGAIGVRATLALSGVLSALCALALLIPGARDVEALPSSG